MSTQILDVTASFRDYDAIVGVIDLFILKERAVLQAEIKKLQSENAALLKENSDLLRQTLSSSVSPATVIVDNEKVFTETRVAALLDKVHYYQRFLVKEREASTLRETNFEQHFRVLQETVKGVMNTTVCVQNHTSEVLSTPAPVQHQDLLVKSPSVQETQKIRNSVVDRVIALSTSLSQRTDEIKKIRKLAEFKAEQATSKIAHLEGKSEGLSLLKTHNNQVDLELDVLKIRLKKLETMALEFVPLAEQDILLDFEAYREELLKIRTRQKQRRKKEARWSLWTG